MSDDGWLPHWWSRLKRSIEPRVLVIGPICCAPVPFYLAIKGYREELFVGWIVLLPVALLLALGVLATMDWLRGWSRKHSSTADADDRDDSGGMANTAILCCMYLVGWGAGSCARNTYCRYVTRQCEPIISALEQYHGEHGRYPASLELLPAYRQLEDEAGIRIGDATTAGSEGQPPRLHEADAVFYLASDRWVCRVPIQRQLVYWPNKFCGYIRTSSSAEWRYANFWRLMTSLQLKKPKAGD